MLSKRKGRAYKDDDSDNESVASDDTMAKRGYARRADNYKVLDVDTTHPSYDTDRLVDVEDAPLMGEEEYNAGVAAGIIPRRPETVYTGTILSASKRRRKRVPAKKRPFRAQAVRRPSGSGGGKCYCFRCKKKVTPVNGKARATARGAMLLQGTCPSCSGKVAGFQAR